MGADDPTEIYPKKVSLPATPDFNDTPETLRVIHTANIEQAVCLNEITVCMRKIGRDVSKEKVDDEVLKATVAKHHVMYSVVLWGAGILGAPGLIWVAVQMFAGSAVAASS